MRNKGNAAIYIVAIACIVLGSILLISNKINTKGYVKTQAVVVGHKENGDSDSKGRAEVVRYNTPDGVFTATNPAYSDFAAKVGDTIDIAYDPDNPSHCVFIKSNALATGILLGVGFLSLIIGIVSTILRKRAKIASLETEDTEFYDDKKYYNDDTKNYRDDDWSNL